MCKLLSYYFNGYVILKGVVSLIWIVLGHSVFIHTRNGIVYNHHKLADEVIFQFKAIFFKNYYTFFNVNINITHQKFLHWTMQVPNQTVAVDTFFLLSGLLVAYSLLRELDRNKGKFNVFLFYIHRYLRFILFVSFYCLHKT